jgi:uncharacterized protein YjbJ (UPF0337 family)
MATEDTLKGKWKQMRGKLQEEWGELSDDELDEAKGERSQIVGLLQEKYGYAKAEAEAKFNKFLAGLDEES